MQEPSPLPDRKALGDIIFDVLGLTEEERKEVFNLPKISFADEKNLIFSEVSCII